MLGDYILHFPLTDFAVSLLVIAALIASRVFTAVKTGTLVLAALLVSGAGFYGGEMAHPAGAPSHHDDVPHEAMMPEQHGAMPPDAITNAPSSDASTMTDASTTPDRSP